MTSTIAAKVIEGLDSQGWQVLGRGGTWAGAVRPLEAYIQRKVERAVRAEREACAKVCDEIAQRDETGYGIAEDCASAIRARSKE